MKNYNNDFNRIKLPGTFYFFFYIIIYGQILVLPFYFVNDYILNNTTFPKFLLIFLYWSSLTIFLLILEIFLYKFKVISDYRSRFFSKSEKFIDFFIKLMTIISYLSVLILYLLNVNGDFLNYTSLFGVLVFWLGVATIVVNLFKNNS
jgi:hypothetical protein